MARFKQEERDYILQFCLTNKDSEVVRGFAQVFGRSVSLYSVRQLRRRLGLIKVGSRGKWEIKGRTQPKADMSIWLFGASKSSQ